MGCVDLRLVEQQQCSEPMLSSFSHMISVATVAISILIHQESDSLNDCETGFTDVGSGANMMIESWCGSQFKWIESKFETVQKHNP